ncbi:hypothetical protein [Streptomyces sp. AM8-1-1]|uniref:hypothetical protein n=1 Tax=Streptomyces sp. AM8-1-1 TaxID=3075825 RepID=UPI0028C4445A|nr:hypothetical protein [Streptomyces sp. AM8-1-1]WNO76906.1 hypothetical protein RPQ07_37170 [Streptomyces sp. AM8-1-1]
MPAQETTPLKTTYADKVAVDLAENTAEQDRIRAELDDLQAQLATLEADQTLLKVMSAALGNTTAALPQPRRGAKKDTAKKTTTAKKTARTAPTAKPEAKKAPAKKTAAKAGGDKSPALTELIHTHLTGQSEPRTAQEIAKALAEAHPGRNVNVNLVRTTTERLVGRSRVERVKEGSTVYYTAQTAADTGDEEKATAAAS